jgi:16S rRNA (adenine1518-N6/adenine1519-N6)-dimethyltransferase
MSNISSSHDLTRNSLIKVARQFRARKHMGQNFLVEPATLRNITECLKISPDESVLEVGAGLGFLTAFLVSTGAKVTTIELDDGFIEHLGNQNFSNLTIVHGDFLKVDIGSHASPRLKIAGNVPYQITSRIIAHVFGEIDKPSPWLSLIDSVVLTIQYEVAQRIVAEPGSKDYSQITLLTNYYSQPEIIEVVPGNHFFPQPRVDSAVVRFIPLQKPAVETLSPRLLRQIIRAGFSQRRKMLKNNLGFLGLSQGKLAQLFDELNFDPQVRAERMSLQQFAVFTDKVHQLQTH